MTYEEIIKRCDAIETCVRCALSASQRADSAKNPVWKEKWSSSYDVFMTSSVTILRDMLTQLDVEAEKFICE